MLFITGLGFGAGAGVGFVIIGLLFELETFDTLEDGFLWGF